MSPGRNGGRPQTHTQAVLIERLQALASTLGRTPTFTELGSLMTPIRRRFGNLSAALKVAGLEQRPRGGRRIALKAPVQSAAAMRKVADVREYWTLRDPTVRSA